MKVRDPLPVLFPRFVPGRMFRMAFTVLPFTFPELVLRFFKRRGGELGGTTAIEVSESRLVIAGDGVMRKWPRYRI